MRWLFLISFLSSLTSWSQEEVFEYSNFHWQPHYSFDSKEPYGGYLLQNLLIERADYYYDIYLPKEDLGEYNYENTLYITYSYDIHWRQSDFDAVIDYVRNGNSAIIMCEELPRMVIRKFFGNDWIKQTKQIANVEYLQESFWDESESTLKNWEIQYISNFDPYKYEYHMMDRNSLDGIYPYEEITSIEGYSAIVKMEYGDGEIYFCSVPMLFSNFYLKTEEGKDHFNHFFDRFEGMDVLIDHKSGEPFIQPKDDDIERRDQNPMANRSILEHIMENSSLFWAYGILLLMGLLYIIFKGKRKRTILQLQESDKNTSKEFITTVSELYLSKNQHRKLVLQKKRVFLHFVRTKYFISGKDDSKAFVDALIVKSGVSEVLVKQIFNRFNQAEQSKAVSVDQLKELHVDIEKFYKTCN